jgi:hypothetical protein
MARCVSATRSLRNTPPPIDPAVCLLLPAAGPASPVLQFSFLHVKGKSGLKHTSQLLECWRQRLDLPLLTVVGRFSWEEARQSIDAANIAFYPKVYRCGRMQGGGGA